MKTQMKARLLRSGFTLVELLIVVTLIALISGMAVGLYGSAVKKSAVTVSMATQKQLLDLFSSYLQLHEGAYPDGFDSLIRSDYVSAGGSYTALGTYSVFGGGTPSLSVAADLTKFIAQPVTSTASADDQSINRGVATDAYSGQARVLTVKQLTADDVTLLTGIGFTKTYDIKNSDLSYGILVTTVRTNAIGGPICIVDPQSVAGQQLYADFGVDLSDPTLYPRNGSSTGAYSWDDSLELNAAGRLAALQKQIFYVCAIGLNSKMAGDQLAGFQEPPASAVVNKGFYNRFSVVIKKYGMDGTADKTAIAVGILDPKGKGLTAARAAINSIK